MQEDRAGAISPPYIMHCPVGCGDTLRPTSMLLPEGYLRTSSDCGQWVSACTERQYWASMREFDTASGTDPKPGAEVRRFEQDRHRLEAIAHGLGQQAAHIRLLDVGCSTGTFLHAAVQLGFEAEGIEPAPVPAQAAREAGLRVKQGDLIQARYPNASFDAVTLFEVIEHVRDALALVKDCHRVLRPGGLLIIGTANTDSWTARKMGTRWEYLDISRHGGHVSFYNPRSLALLAQRAGLTAELIRTRKVRLADRDTNSRPAYAAGKLAGELLNLPARIVGRGHDMLAVLRRV